MRSLLLCGSCRRSAARIPGRRKIVIFVFRETLVSVPETVNAIAAENSRLPNCAPLAIVVLILFHAMAERALVETRRLQAKGDLSHLLFSEVRLPI